MLLSFMNSIIGIFLTKAGALASPKLDSIKYSSLSIISSGIPGKLYFCKTYFSVPFSKLFPFLNNPGVPIKLKGFHFGIDNIFSTIGLIFIPLSSPFPKS